MAGGAKDRQTPFQRTHLWKRPDSVSDDADVKIDATDYDYLGEVDGKKLHQQGGSGAIPEDFILRFYQEE
ncbi:MAG TPA: hypothetical protein VJ969_03035, partial [Desulfopila sp.]|nr:hypothetical protein [Desulfopila sp.]